MSKIKCLVCGKKFEFLPPHICRMHGMSCAEYREEFDLAVGMPLASDEYRKTHSDKILRMQIDGVINYDHLPDASEKSRRSKERPKRGDAIKKQKEVLKKSRPWEKNQLPPGAKRADGRNADKARAYQREYRRKKAQKK